MTECRSAILSSDQEDHMTGRTSKKIVIYDSVTHVNDQKTSKTHFESLMTNHPQYRVAIKILSSKIIQSKFVNETESDRQMINAEVTVLLLEILIFLRFSH